MAPAGLLLSPKGPEGDDRAALLAPYLPQLALDWVRQWPDQRHRRLEGSLLFVDVSGFTALTERLAARGKVGAEEITDVIGAVFGELLGVASSYGADLLKWGGDAVLLYFSEPDSAARAGRAAVLITRTMKRIGNFKTASGRVKLGVSVGGHSGAFDLYLLGDRHRELIVTGPAATVTARMEAIAESGEVVVSTGMADRVEGGVLGPPKGDGVLLSDPPDIALRPAQRTADLVPAEVMSLMAADRREHLLGGGDQAEHRQATIAFIEFSGIDALTQEGGGPAVAEWLDPVVAATQRASEHYGVHFHETDIGPDGGKIVLLGGAPLLRGNDAERALRAVHEVVADHPVESPIRLRAGVNTGRVFVFSHDFVAARRRVFAVTGDAVNLAARVMGKAGAGQVVATEGTLIQAEHPFEVERLAPFKVKGKSEPVIASAVGAPRYADDEPIGDGLPFVGRDGELAEILTLAEAAAHGVGAVLEIAGPSGIGKSRLVSEAAERWTLSSVRVGCQEYGSVAPYRPFRRVLHRLLGITDDSPDDVAAEVLRGAVRTHAPDIEPYLPLLADVIGLPVPATRQVEELEPRFRRSWLEQCVVALLRGYLSAPSALIFEDAHAMDEASVSLLARLGDEVARLPLLVLLTTHGDDGPVSKPDGRVVILGPLPSEASTQLARSGDHQELSPAQIAAIVERADGNPLFLRELLRNARQSGGTAVLPDSLEPLLAAEIDRLAPTDRQVLRAASVLGNHVEPALLSDVVEGELLADEAIWSRLGVFIVPTAAGRRFVNSLMRDAAYEGLSFRRRKELHGRAALAIERRARSADEASDLLSHHWLHAEVYDRAWVHARAAGHRARSLWANAEAAIFFARALEAAGHLSLARSDVLTVAEALGDTSELAATYDRARQAYAKASRLSDGAADRARIIRKIGVLHERLGRYPEALRCYTRGRRVLLPAETSASEVNLRDAPATERCELDLASAGVRLRQGRYRDGLRFARDAAHDAATTGNQSGLAHAFYLQHLISVYLTEPDDELGHEALRIFDGLGDLVGQGNALNNLGISAYYRGRWVDAMEYYERSRQARLRSGDVVGAATEENNIAEILSDQGHLDRAAPLFESAADTWRGAGYKVGVALATSNLGRLAARVGDSGSGRRRLEEAEALFRQIGSGVFLAETQLRLCECEVLSGDFSTAGASLQVLLENIGGRPGLEHAEAAALRLVGVAGAFGDTAQQWESALDRAVERSTTIDDLYEQALARASRSALAGGGTDDRPRADDLFEQLGVVQSVITWAQPAGAGPLFAIGPRALVS